MREPSQTSQRRDLWAEWLLRRRHGGPPEAREGVLRGLAPVRDRVLQHAHIQPGETALDVACGDGLIAFGALERVGPTGRVIFCDISQELLDTCAELAREMGRQEQCAFVRASADDLSLIGDASVDVVTTRSVLIYVQRKREALHEFYRVLRPGGRISLFEPINRFAFPEPPGRFLGYDVTPVLDLAMKVLAAYALLAASGETTMLDFDERDLLSYAEEAGFAEVHVDLHLQVVSYPRAFPPLPPIPESVPEAKREAVREQMHAGLFPAMTWEAFARSAPNPHAPTLEEAMAKGLTASEAERFTAHLRPLVERDERVERAALAYLWAVKHEGV